MPRKRSRLARELRKGTCPQRVLDEVRRQIAAEAPARAPWRFAIPFAVAAFALICGVSVWRWQTRENARQARIAEQTWVERTEAANQAKDALGLVGSVLLNAGADSEKIISARAVPPLQNSLYTAKNKIIPIEL